MLSVRSHSPAGAGIFWGQFIFHLARLRIGRVGDAAIVSLIKYGGIDLERFWFTSAFSHYMATDNGSTHIITAIFN
jgi:hypothetical protein